MSKVSKAWTIMPRGNSTLEDKDFYISYNNTSFMNTGIFMSDNGDAETAIYKDGKYYILNGDFRQEYENLFDKGFEACIQFFLEHEAEQSSWSNEYEPEELEELG